MSTPRRHHFLPRAYLNRFAQTEGRGSHMIWLHRAKASIRVSTKHTGVERDFYGKGDESLELALGPVDAEWSEFLRQAEEDDLDSLDKQRFLTSTVFHALRSRSVRSSQVVNLQTMRGIAENMGAGGAHKEEALRKLLEVSDAEVERQMHDMLNRLSSDARQVMLRSIDALIRAGESRAAGFRRYLIKEMQGIAPVAWRNLEGTLEGDAPVRLAKGAHHALVTKHLCRAEELADAFCIRDPGSWHKARRQSESSPFILGDSCGFVAFAKLDQPRHLSWGLTGAQFFAVPVSSNVAIYWEKTDCEVSASNAQRNEYINLCSAGTSAECFYSCTNNEHLEALRAEALGRMSAAALLPNISDEVGGGSAPEPA